MNQSRFPRPALGAALLAAALAALACGGESRTAEQPEVAASDASDASNLRQDQSTQPIEIQEPHAGETDGEPDQYSDLAPPPLPDLDADRAAQAAEQELDERERLLAEREQRLAERKRARPAERERPSAPAESVERAERERQARRDAELQAERREAERQAQLEADDAARAARRQEEARGREEVAQREDLPAQGDDRAALERPEPDSAPAAVSLPAGSSFDVELGDTLSSQASEPGDIFRARVTADVYEDGVLAIPRGSSVVGEVTQAQSTRRVGGRAVLGLRFSDLVLPSGETVPLAASLVEQGRSETGRDAAAIGGGAAAGAILGRILNKGDKSRGAILGAILGAAAGTVVAARTPGEEVTIPEGAVLTLRLDDEVELRRRDRR